MENETELESLRAAPKADRLRYLREFAHLDRNEAAEMTRVSFATYKDWENSKAIMPKQRAFWLIDDLQMLGVDCTFEWLMNGVGAAPRKTKKFLQTETFIENISNSKVFKKQKEAAHITKELDFFCQHNPHAIGLIVMDDAMAPKYKCHDVVAGIQYSNKKIAKLAGLDCIVKLKTGKFLLRNLQLGTTHDCYTLVCANPNKKIKQTIPNVELICAAPIIWHRQKLPD